MKKKLLAILLTLAMVVTMIPAVFVTVTAEAANLYPGNEWVEVSNAQQWKDNVKAGKNIRLTGSFTLEGAPLYSFYNGLIDGQGNTITVNYVIGAEDETFTPAQYPKIGGLFSRLYGCTIKDLTVTGNVSLAKDVTTHESPLEMGGIAGTVDGTVALENVTCSVNVTVTAEPNTVVGGFFGQTARNGTANTCNTTPNVTMTDCVYNGTVSVVGGTAGGFIAANLSTLKMTNCVAKGTVTANKNGSTYLGGILGRSNVSADSNSDGIADGSATLVNCENQAAIKDGLAMGGIVGFLPTHGSVVCNTTLTNCVNRGNVISELPTSLGWPSVGGIIGDTDWAKHDLDATGCVNYGEVASLNNNGGIMGSSKIKDVLTDGDYTLKDCANFGNVHHFNNTQAGGVIQYVCAAAMRLEGCANYADLTANSIAGIAMNVNYVQKLELIDCVNYGDLTGTYIIGGMIRYIQETPGESQYTGTVTIDGCANHGDLSLTNGDYEFNYAGGLVGDVKASTGTFTVSNSANYGTVTAKSGVSAGIVAALHNVKTAVIEDCYNLGIARLTGAKAENNHQAAAGIVGRLDGNIDLDITRCHNLGTVSMYVHDWAKAGGILGLAFNLEATMAVDITNCASFGKVEIYDYRSAASVNPQICGIAGQVKAKSGSTLNINGCYTNGLIVDGEKAAATKQANLAAGNTFKFYGAAIYVAANSGTTEKVTNCVSAHQIAEGSLCGTFGVNTSGNLDQILSTEMADVLNTLHRAGAGTAFVLDGEQLEPVYALNTPATQVFATQEANTTNTTVDVRVLALVNSLNYDNAGVRIYNADKSDSVEKTTTTVYSGVVDATKGTVNAPYGTYYLPITVKGVGTTGTYTFIVETFVEKGGVETKGATYTVVVDNGVVSAKKN